ncbi:MAG TPA: ABC transporter substrate-binding protein [Stellaceae bacterium]|jgi:peptide/nickel transport system substrate-binding protein|nr:ABC transporter substrate-binding protein [Stellaceae bacterium]
MNRRGFVLALTAALALPTGAWAALIETPFLADEVAAGKLPPVAQRIPHEPSLAELETLGRPGGDLRMLMASPKDTRLMVVYGYARLVSSTPSLAIVPDILKAVDVQEGRIFTLHLRAGHKWSDGQPFTAEDFRYWFEDMANNPELSATGLPVAMLPNGDKPEFELVDPETVRYSWPRPNPLFLPALAGAYPLYIYAPAHYLKQFHEKYADKAALAALVKKANARNWASLHIKLDNEYRNDNPKLPTLQPWVLVTKPPADRIVFERNPYYYRVDGAGHQLPYIDRVVFSIADSKIIPAKTGAGESDLQARYLRFDDYTFLKAGEAENGYKVRLWRTAPGSQLALYPDLNAADPVWRRLMDNVDFRRALSLGINRHEINQVIYFGLAIEGQNTVLPQSPLYRPEYRDSWAQFDPGQANKLLDGLGLEKRDSEGTRLLPDGRTLDLIVEDSGESSEKSDILELIRDSWRHIGVRLFSKPEQITLFRERVFSGQAQLSLDNGIENGLATADRSPAEFAPTSQQQLEWPRWGQYMETKGKAGEPPDLPPAAQLKDLYGQWLAATSEAEHARIWHAMLKIYADQVFSIGLVAGVLQPVVVNKRLRNVPEQGIYAWDPGAQFGIYKPDGFWFDTQGGASAALSPTGR